MKVFRIQNISRKGDTSERAFTFTDLLVVVVVLGLLLFVLIPVQADSRKKTRGVRCLDNQRQIMAAFLMYTHDNHDLLPPNPEDTYLAGHNWCQGDAGFGGSAEFNPDPLANPQRCLITAYIGTNLALFRCTFDTRVGVYQGTNAALIGKTVPAARSISMNQAVGTMCPGYDAGGSHAGKPILSVNGAWLDNTHSNRRNSPYRTYGKLADVIMPSPSKLWVITEEDPYSLNDGGFGFGMSTAEWIDFVSTQHGMACVLGFGDGHVELHRWADQWTQGRNPPYRISVPGSADYAWLRDRTSARAQ